MHLLSRACMLQLGPDHHLKMLRVCRSVSCIQRCCKNATWTTAVPTLTCLDANVGAGRPENKHRLCTQNDKDMDQTIQMQIRAAVLLASKSR